MATIQEKVPDPEPTRVDPEVTRASYSDEKLDEKRSHDGIETAESVKGDVYEDIREIDLDENGRERPIGMLL
jgi:hypothetical protein